jgi:two-component system response regulator (stage 0 sporulation protein A)
MKKIVLADNNKEFCSVLCDQIINEKDMTLVGVANNVNEAVIKIIQDEPDVVILHINKTEITARDVIGRVNSTPLKCRPVFIVVSDNSNEDHILETLESGASYYLIKPFKTEFLFNLIRKLK